MSYSVTTTEIDRFFKKTDKIVIPRTIREILDEEITGKLT